MAAKTDVIVRFWGGPEDGAERSMPLPLGDILEIEATSTATLGEEGIKSITKVIYLYRLTTHTRRYQYRFEGDRIEREEVE